jgi:Sec-independent protein translocase protein TatA
VRKAQTAFEYVLLLAAVLLLVTMAIVLLNATVLPSAFGDVQNGVNAFKSGLADLWK